LLHEKRGGGRETGLETQGGEKTRPSNFYTTHLRKRETMTEGRVRGKGGREKSKKTQEKEGEEIAATSYH